MAEALAAIGLVSAIIQFTEFGAKIVARLNEFGSNVNDLPKAFRSIKINLPVILDSLERTKRSASTGEISQATASALEPLVEECFEQVKQLQDILDKNLPTNSAKNWQRRLQAIKSLSHEKDVEQISSKLDRCVQTLNFYHTSHHSELLNRLTIDVTPQDRVHSQTASSRGPLFMVPFHRDDQFVGREEILAELDETLKNQHRRAVLAGIGGVGKSQIAIEYCYRYKKWQPNGQVFWVHSSNRNRFAQAYKEIAKNLNLHGLDDPTIDSLQLVKEWLSDDDSGPWLMVLDNADDKDLIFGTNAQASSNKSEQEKLPALITYLPQSSNCSVLVTTRDKRIGERLANRRKPILVLPFGVKDAMQLLKNKLGDRDNCSKEDLMELLESVNFLPLAITQAAAYITEEDVTVARYLELFRTSSSDAKELLEQEYYDAGRDSEIQNSIFLTWKISFDQIRKQKSRAADILSLMAVVDRQSIPVMLLRTLTESNVDFDTAVGTLKAFSLVTEEKKGAVYSVHRLVQLSTQRWLELRHAQIEWYEKALNAAHECCPDHGEYESWAIWEMLYPHAQIVLGFSLESEVCLLQRASILCRVSHYEYVQGQFRAALEKILESLRIQRALLGDKHVDTLSSMDVLGLVFISLQRYDEAEETNWQTLKIREEVLGKEHPFTLVSLGNLASTFIEQKKFDEAEEINRRLLVIYTRDLGQEHPKTLLGMNNLAINLVEQNKLDEAEEIQRQIFKLYEEGVGQQHPRTLLYKNNLALTLGEQKNFEEAEVLFEQVLKLRGEVLGHNHPNTLNTMDGLGMVLYNQEKYNEAEPLFRELLALRNRVLGEEHPETIKSMNHLAWMLHKQSKDEEAEPILKELLALRKRLLGEEHPDTLICMNNLALVLYKQGKYEEAEPIYKELLALQKRVLGEEHPRTRFSMEYLSMCIDRQDKA